MALPVRKHMQEIFSNSQVSATSHERLLKQLTHLYQKTPPDAFQNEFIRCLHVPLYHGEMVRSVENTLNFASLFVASLLQKTAVNANQTVEGEEEEEICPFVSSVWKFLFENHSTEQHKAIRFRVCQFINKILNGLGNEACIDDYLCDQISECMMERLWDKAPAVRLQAVLALHRLQDPTDANCPVMKAFMFHMSSDTNADVRRAVITNIAISSQSVRCILERTHDCKDSVRRTAFVSLSKLGVQRFTIIQRVRLLTDGLKDPSAIVRDCVAKVMLPSWLQFYKGSFLSLLHALDSDNSTEISSLALKALFKTQPLKTVLEELTKLLSEDKVIPVKDLSPENVLYWRILHEYLEAHPELADDQPIDEPLPELLPELSTFCNYLREYFEAKLMEEAEHWVKLQNQYILIQLLELCKHFDFADEMGRANLKNLCLYFLTNTAVSEDLVPVMVQIMVRVVPDVEDCLQALAEAISEVREPMTEQEPEATTSAVPSLSGEELRQKEFKQASIRVKINELQEEKDDAIRNEDFQLAQAHKGELEKLQAELQALTEILACPPPPAPAQTEVRDVAKDEKALQKCLRIVREMTGLDPVKSLSATLRSLLHNFILPCLQEDNSSIIRNKALECLGLFCILDKDLAQENFVMFCFQIANDEVCEIALKVTFDLLLLYGLQTFQVQEENGDISDKKKSKKKKNLFVTDMFDEEFDTEGEESQETHTIVSTGSSGNTANLISMLTSLLDSASTSMRNLAMEGLCKLLLACQITSSALLSRLILMWYSPVTEGDETLRQPLGVFLTVYASHCPCSQETLEQAFLPTLRTLMQAPVTSPLTQVDQDSVARLFLSLTRPGINKFQSKMGHIHNNLALSICNAVMDCDDSTNIGVLLRALTSLELALDDPIYRDELNTLIKMAGDVFRASKEKLFLRHLEKIGQLIEVAAENVLMRTTEVENTAAGSELEGTHCNTTANTTVIPDVEQGHKSNKNAKLLHPRMHSILAENEMDDDDDEEDDSQKTPPITSSVIIAPSPPRSLSSDNEEESANTASENGNSEDANIKQSKGSQNSDMDTDGENVFKKPAAKAKSVRSKNEDSRKAATSRDNETAPKRRKAGDEKVEQKSVASQPSQARGARNRKPVNEQNEVPSADNKTLKKSAVPSNKRNARGDTQDDAWKEISPKRHINPTEKGATLKTFQNISSSNNPMASPTSTPPPKRMKKASRKGESTSAVDCDASTLAQPSETSASASPRKSLLDRPSTRRNALFQKAADSPDSPPISAAQLRLRMTKKAVKTSEEGSRADGTSDSEVSASPHGTSKGKALKKVGKLSPLVSSSTSGPESDSSPKPRNVRRVNEKERVSPSQSAEQKADTSSRSTRSKAEAKMLLVPSTRSGLRREESNSTPPARKSQQFSKLPSSGSIETDSDSSPLPVSRRNKNAVSSPHQPTSQPKRTTPSINASTSDGISDDSPAVSMSRQHHQGSQVTGIKKLPVKSTKSVQARSTRRSASQSDAEGTTQGSEALLSDQSDNMSPTYMRSRRSLENGRQSSDSPVSAAQLAQRLKRTAKPGAISQVGSKQKRATPDDSSPARVSREQVAANDKVQLAKKRPAQALKSTSSDSFDVDSPELPSRVGRVSRNTSNKASPTPPQKRTRTKTPSKDSPQPSTSRRSLRSQVETPSPRTRSGNV